MRSTRKLLAKFRTRIVTSLRKFVLLWAGSPLVSVGLRRRLLAFCGVRVGKTSVVYGQLFIPYGHVQIAEGTFVNYGFRVIGQGVVQIDSQVSIGPDVRIYTDTHPLSNVGQRADRQVLVKFTRIGVGSWIGGNVTILPGVSVASGCVIGAGSVLTRSTEPDGLYVGVPATRVRDLPVLEHRAAPDRNE